MAIAPEFMHNDDMEKEMPKKKPQKCKKCPAEFSEKEHLEMHMKNKHGM